MKSIILNKEEQHHSNSFDGYINNKFSTRLTLMPTRVCKSEHKHWIPLLITGYKKYEKNNF